MGFAFWYGGIVQVLAGMWAMKVGNTFEATAFSSFGAYWIAYGYMFMPNTMIRESYANTPPGTMQNATGIFLLVWALLAVILTLGTTRSTVSTVIMFIFLDIHLFFLVVNEFGHYPDDGWPKKVGSICGIITALMAFYNGAAALWLPSNSHILLPVGPFNNNNDIHVV
jgi:succinate-acetate transporter protein